MKRSIANLAVFKAAWTAVVVSAAAGVPAFGAVAVAVAVGIHLLSSDNVAAEARLLLVAALLGLAWESWLVQAGLLQYASGTWIPGLAPYWIVAMWVLFATVLNTGMRWLRRSKAVAAIAGGIGGPLGFVAGASVGAVELVSPVLTLICIGIGWAALLPLLVQIAARLDDGDRPVEQSA
jgi:hypothetical protein